MLLHIKQWETRKTNVKRLISAIWLGLHLQFIDKFNVESKN